MSEENPVLVESAAGVMTITINRPKAKNAVNKAVAEGISAAIDELEANDELRVAILTGADGTFCSGMDLKAFVTGELPMVEGRGFAGLVEYLVKKPMIAAVEGYALAGGFEVAISCDLIVAADNCKFGIPEVKRGLAAAGGEGFALEFALRPQFGRAGDRKNLRVARLVIVGGVRIRDQHRGQPEAGQLGQRRGAGTADRQIRRGVGKVHFRAKGQGFPGDSRRIESGRDPIVIRRPGDVEHLEGGVPRQHRQGLDDEFIDTPRALGTAHHQQSATGRIEPEKRKPLGALGPGRDLRTQRGAGDDGAATGKMRGARLEAHQHGAGKAGVEPVGASGDGVRLVNKGRQAANFPGDERRGRGEASHPEHGVGIEAPEQPVTLPEGGPEVSQETEHPGGRDLRHRDRFLSLETQMLEALGRERVDLFFRNNQQRLPSPGAPFLGHRDPGKQMPPRAATGDDEAPARGLARGGLE